MRTTDARPGDARGPTRRARRFRWTGLAVSTLLGLAGAAPTSPVRGQEPVRVVTTLAVYASIAEEVGGEGVEVESIAGPVVDAHFVRPTPSFAVTVRNADVFVTTGLDLELWVPALLDRAGNAAVSEGGQGYVAAHTGIQLLDVPATVSRSEGDVHIYGNPHLHTDPLRALQVARNITTGLRRVDPARQAVWGEGLSRFADRIHRALFGDELVDILGGESLERLALAGTLDDFLQSNQLEGRPLSERLGGWLARARPLKGLDIICYHKNWAYLEDRFGVTCAEYVEPRPGIPATPRHLSRLVGHMHEHGHQIVLAANYFDDSSVRAVAGRGEGRAVVVPLYPGGADGVTTYFDLIDYWIDALLAARTGHHH
jgi:zinc/manganese transport system substrate-binding protein